MSQTVKIKISNNVYDLRKDVASKMITINDLIIDTNYDETQVIEILNSENLTQEIMQNFEKYYDSIDKVKFITSLNLEPIQLKPYIQISNHLNYQDFVNNAIKFIAKWYSDQPQEKFVEFMEKLVEKN